MYSRLISFPMKLESRLWSLPLSKLQQTSAKRQDSEEESPLAKRLHDMQEGLRQLRSLPSAKESAKQQALAKVELLKRRMEQLRAMLIAATPEQAKALLRQIAGIAKELASMAKLLDGASGGATPSPSVSAGQTNATQPSGAGQSAGNDANAAAVANTGDAAEHADAETAEAPVGSGEESPEQTATAGESESDKRQTTSSDTDKRLRASLQEAAKRLKALIELLKAKLRDGDRQEHGELRRAEKSMHELDDALNGSQLYSSLGSSLGASALSSSLTGTTGSIAVSTGIDVQA